MGGWRSGDMGLPFASALAYFHEQLATVDQDAVLASVFFGGRCMTAEAPNRLCLAFGKAPGRFKSVNSHGIRTAIGLTRHSNSSISKSLPKTLNPHLSICFADPRPASGSEGWGRGSVVGSSQANSSSELLVASSQDPDLFQSYARSSALHP